MGQGNWGRRQHQEVDLLNLQHNRNPWVKSNWGARQDQEEIYLPNMQVEQEKLGMPVIAGLLKPTFTFNRELFSHFLITKNVFIGVRVLKINLHSIVDF